MSDIIMKESVRPYGELIAYLLPVADDLVCCLRQKHIPESETISTAEALLKEAILRIDLDQMTDRQIGTAIFHDSFGREPSEDYVFNLLNRFPDIWNTLTEIARRKVVSSDDTLVEGETGQQLIKEEFLAPVEIRTCFGSGELYTLTSGGYRWLSFCRSLQTTEAVQPLDSLPEGLHYLPKDWSAVSFCKVFLLQQYFKTQNISRYLIYSTPGNANILLGCPISASPEVRYCYAWIPGSANSIGGHDYLRELIGSASVNEVVIVYPFEKDKEEIMECINSFPYREKIMLFCLEVENK